MEIVRFLLGEYASRPDAIDMRTLLGSIEAQLVDNLMSRPMWDTANEADRILCQGNGHAATFRASLRRSDIPRTRRQQSHLLCNRSLTAQDPHRQYRCRAKPVPFGYDFG